MARLADEDRLRPRRLLDRADAEPSMFMNDITKLFWQIASHDSPQEGVSNGYRRMFHILCRHDGITQVELAKAAQLSSPSVSTALNKMEADGLVKRVPDERDRRKVYVFITDKGREQDKYIREQCRSAEAVMMNGFTPEEREQLMAMLRRMLINLLEEDSQ